MPQMSPSPLSKTTSPHLGPKSPLFSKYFQPPGPGAETPAVPGGPIERGSLTPAPLAPLRTRKRSLETGDRVAKSPPSKPAIAINGTSRVSNLKALYDTPRVNLAATTSTTALPGLNYAEKGGMNGAGEGARAPQPQRSLSRDDMPKPLSPATVKATAYTNGDHTARSSVLTTPANQTQDNAEGLGGYQLKAETYSPNTQVEFARKEQLWSQMNHAAPESSIEARFKDKSSEIKSPRTLHDRRNQVAQNPRFAPQLPPLFFESETKIAQKDFAYQDPPHSAVPLGYRVAQDPPPSLKVSSAPLGPHPSEHRPIPRLRHTQARRAVDSATTETHASSESEYSDDESVVRTPPRKNPIEKALGPAGEGTTNSFYWHSPQSSSGSTEDSSPMVTARSEPPQATGVDDFKAAELALTSATALGFGGPSDWEHFGDYDGEEIDDIALYVSSKPKTAELSIPTSQEDDAATQPLDVPKQLEQQPPPPLPHTGILPEIPLLGEGGLLPSIEEIPIVASIEGKATKAESPKALLQADEPTSSPRGSSLAISTDGRATPPNSRDPPTASVDHLQGGEAADSSSMTHLENSPTKDGLPHAGQDAIRRPDPPHLDISAAPGNTNAGHTPIPPTIKMDGMAAQGHDERKKPDDRAAGSGLERQLRHPPAFPATHSTTWSSGDSANPSSRVRSPPAAMNRKHIQRRITTDTEAGEDIIISLEVPGSPPNEGAQQLDSLSDRLHDRSAPAPSTLVSTATSTTQPATRVGRRSMFPQFVELENPYEHLDPWAKASLNRYVKMLRDEAQAETDEEKYMIFCSFTDRETRLRTVLYDMEEEESDGRERTIRLPSGKTSTLPSTSREVPAIKALPALPALGMGFNLGSTAVSMSESPTRQESDEAFIMTKRESNPTQEAEKIDMKPAKASNDESFVMVDSPTVVHETLMEKTTSPPVLRKRPSMPTKNGSSMNSLRKALDLVTNKGSKNGKQSAAAIAAAAAIEPPISKDVAMDRTEGSGSRTGTPQSAHDADHVDNASPPEQPLYTAYNSGEGKPYEGDKAANRQTIYRPFSMLLRQTSQRQSSVDGGAGSLEKSPSIRRLTVGSMTGPDGQPLPDSLGIGLRPPSIVPNVPPIPPNYRYTILGPLLAVVPMTSDLRSEPATVKDLRQQMEAVQDDFSFIHATVLAWDGEAKQIRERQERERNARQNEMEQRIDALFNEHEIGYADISELEAESKKKEAGIKAAEDHAEFQSFVAHVFDEVWARLHYEMDQLIPLYDICTKLVADASAGKEMFEDHGDDRVPIAPAMEILLVLYQKLHVRHQKAFEAVLERDRRLKKSELALWFALDNLDKVKAINGRFEAVEKKAILEFCRQRDERANLLMDVLDQNTLRGVGSNQDYMESVMQAVRRIAADVAAGLRDQHGTSTSAATALTAASNTAATNGTSAPSLSSASAVSTHSVVSTEEIHKARAITAALARSSEQIVQTFHVADMILNAADYEVSVANAKLSNADAASFRRLREAKAKEDTKLVRDLEHRMALVRGDTARTQDEIARLLALLEKEKERAKEGALI